MKILLEVTVKPCDEAEDGAVFNVADLVSEVRQIEYVGDDFYVDTVVIKDVEVELARPDDFDIEMDEESLDRLAQTHEDNVGMRASDPWRQGIEPQPTAVVLY